MRGREEQGELCPGSGGTVNPQDLCHVCKQKVRVYLPDEGTRFVTYRSLPHMLPEKLDSGR